jgi:glycogen(starch) synthase
MLKLAIVSYEFPPHNGSGGVAFYSYNLAQLLSESCLVYVFSGADLGSKSIYEQSKINNFISIVVNCKSSDDFIYKVVDVFKKFHQQLPFDLIESPEVGACALEIKKAIPSLPLIVKLHSPTSLLGYYVVKNAPFKLKTLWYIKWISSMGNNSLTKFYIPAKVVDKEYQIIQMANVLYAPSKSVYSNLINLWGINLPCQFINNYYPFDISISSTLLLKKENSIKNATVITFVGKLTFLKGADVLFNLLLKLSASDLNFQFNIVGNDEGDLFSNKYLSKYKSVIDTNSNKIKVYSRLTNKHVLEILEKSHIVLVPSLWENQPTVIFEAISRACLVIANDIGGIPEIIDDKKTGFVIKNNRVAEYYSTIVNIIRNPEVYAFITRNAISKCSVLFDKDQQIQKQIALYSTLINT